MKRAKKTWRSCADVTCARRFEPDTATRYYCSEECAYLGMLRRAGGEGAKIRQIIETRDERRRKMADNAARARAAAKRKRAEATPTIDPSIDPSLGVAASTKDTYRD